MANEEINYGLFAETTSEGIVLSGKTFDLKDIIKQMGGKWQPASKTWLLAPETDLAPLRPILLPWVCCVKAHSLDSRNQTLVCPVHWPNGKKPWWFCGHEGARIISMRSQMHSCRTCAGPEAWGDTYVRGMNYRHND